MWGFEIANPDSCLLRNIAWIDVSTFKQLCNPISHRACVCNFVTFSPNTRKVLRLEVAKNAVNFIKKPYITTFIRPHGSCKRHQNNVKTSLFRFEYFLNPPVFLDFFWVVQSWRIPVLDAILCNWVKFVCYWKWFVPSLELMISNTIFVVIFFVMRAVIKACLNIGFGNRLSAVVAVIIVWVRIGGYQLHFMASFSTIRIRFTPIDQSI